jgi:hypothetical protein
MSSIETVCEVSKAFFFWNLVNPAGNGVGFLQLSLAVEAAILPSQFEANDFNFSLLPQVSVARLFASRAAMAASIFEVSCAILLFIV